MRIKKMSSDPRRHCCSQTNTDRRVPGRVFGSRSARSRCSGHCRSSCPERSGSRATLTRFSWAVSCLQVSARHRPDKLRSMQASRSAAACTTVNKMCGSGMETIMLGHDLIRAGQCGRGRRRRARVDDQRALPVAQIPRWLPHGAPGSPGSHVL